MLLESNQNSYSYYRRPFTEYSNSKHLHCRKAFKLIINSCSGERSTVGVKRGEDVVKQAEEMIRKSGHGGPPCWFTPLDCGKPPLNAPLLLYLPGFFLFQYLKHL